MNTDEIARREASEILRLTLEENPRTPPHILADRAIETFLKIGAPNIKDCPPSR